MCGIVGYVGEKQAKEVLINGLLHLENRGYDAAGMAVWNGKNIASAKAIGRPDNLRKKVQGLSMPGKMGIAHTRWCTHGDPDSETDAHPHIDCKGEIFVVHNGTIESDIISIIKPQLKERGHKFVSGTDTELIAHMIEECMSGNLTAAVRTSMMTIQGACVIAVMSSRDPGKIVAANKGGSSLVLGITQNEYFLASEPSAITRQADRMVRINDGDIVTVTADGYNLRSINTYESVSHELEKLPRVDEDEGCGDFPHRLRYEISQQPVVVQDAMRGRIDADQGIVTLGGLHKVRSKLRNMDRLVIVACGSAYYAAQVGEYMINELAGVPVEVHLGSEFRYRRTNLKKNTVVAVISQSGETADTLESLREANRQGAVTLGIVNRVGSVISRETTAGVYCRAGIEKSVASTKSFMAQLTVLALWALYIARLKGLSPAQARDFSLALSRIPEQLDRFIPVWDTQARTQAQRYRNAKGLLYLGRLANRPIASEGALKLKEISYVHAEGYASGEMKHGPIALVERDFPCVVICPSDNIREKNLLNIKEIQSRRSPIIAIGTQGDLELVKETDDNIMIPETHPLLTPLLTVVPLQLFAYHFAEQLGRPIDHPRNLAKAVTVE